MKTVFRHCAISALLFCIAWGIAGCEKEFVPKTFSSDGVYQGVLQNPSDLVYFKGRFVATELYSNRLAILESLDDQFPDYLLFGPDGQHFKSPHNLAVTPWNTLLISNGWGNSLVEISELDGTGWREFSGRDIPFNAPHGVCVDEDNWIYVADSLNSRLVRFKDMGGKDWQVFTDIDKKVGYIRQLVCNQQGVWAANTYEKRQGINPGQGSNVLLIEDFDSGQVSEQVIIPGDSTTGVMPLHNRVALTLWHGYPNIGLFLKQDQNDVVKFTDFPKSLGTPYSIYKLPDEQKLVFIFFGSLQEQGQANPGGLAELTYK